MKKILWIIIFIKGLLFCSCKKTETPSVTSNYSTVNVRVTTAETGYIYLDGLYTGFQTPYTINVTKGKHIIGVAQKSSFQYLRKEFVFSSDTEVNLTNTDRPDPKIWKALWIGLYETKGNSGTGDCSTHFTRSDLDQGYDFFRWSITNHFEKYSYGTMKWDIERKDIQVPVQLKKSNESWFTVEPDVIAKLSAVIQPGAYDCVFVFWRESEGACSFKSNYFGLAWTNPMAETIKTGYVTVKLEPGANLSDKINYYKNNDPGVWIHEWLHTTGENFYQNQGKKMPQKAKDGLAVHAAEMYDYKFPWMNWYLDFMSGRVPDFSGEPKYAGIGPETFLNCTVRETASGSCN